VLKLKPLLTTVKLFENYQILSKPSNFVKTIKFSQKYEIVSVKIFKYCKKLLNLEKNYQVEKIIKYSPKFQIHAISYEK
jgi:hypothetical protein